MERKRENLGYYGRSLYIKTGDGSLFGNPLLPLAR